MLKRKNKLGGNTAAVDRLQAEIQLLAGKFVFELKFLHVLKNYAIL